MLNLIFKMQNLPNIEQKVGKIRKVFHSKNSVEYEILVTYIYCKGPSDKQFDYGNTLFVLLESSSARE